MAWIRNHGYGGAHVRGSLYEGVLDKFNNEMAADIIIIPSSIQEVLLLPFTETFKPDELKHMVSIINGTLEV